MKTSLFRHIFVGAVLVVVTVGVGLITLGLRTPRGIKYVPHHIMNVVRYSLARTQGIVHPVDYIKGYAKFTLKPLFFVKRNDTTELAKEHIPNFNLNFYNYDEQALVFGELFIEECYYFLSKKQNPFIIDCGANIGMATLYFKKYLYPQAEIIAFEPDPCNFSVLQKNIEQNNLANVTLVNKALSNANGQASFCVDRKGSTSAHIVFGQAKTEEEKQKIMIDCVRLSDYLDKQVDLLKLDVEGSEGLVLEDLEKAGKIGLIKEMFIEFHNHGAKTLGSVLSTLDANDFSYSLKQGQTLIIRALNRKMLD